MSAEPEAPMPPAATGELVAIAVHPGVGVGFANAGSSWWRAWPDAIDEIVRLETDWRPRWVHWSSDTARVLVQLEVRVATAWDVAAVHRLVFGGWRADPARIWATLRGLDPGGLPTLGQLDFLSAAGDEGDPEDPCRPDGYLRPEWIDGGHSRSPEHLARWAALALDAAQQQAALLAELAEVSAVRALRTARAESTVELLCAELEADGLPIDRAEAERIIAGHVGPRGVVPDEARRARDRPVLDLVPNSDDIDLRSPMGVQRLLRRVGIEVPDTRAARLERHVADHPVVAELLTWRKRERVATTYGYGWLDTHVGADGRLRGGWSSSDGAAGRMTAQAGLHNLPAELRPAVAADPGHVFVQADLGQIEPRVLAAVSGDEAFSRAAETADLYAPVAKRIGVDRPTAKIAVLAAMYGQTSGAAGRALAGMEQAYPVALGYLRAAEERGRAGTDVRTDGGRLVRMWPDDETAEAEALRSAAAARGRYARNAMVQGAAAELFKLWAVTVRARLRHLPARIVLCLHDELIVHCPEPIAEEVAATVHDGLAEAAARWRPAGTTVRFVADVGIVRRWSDAKP